MASVLIKRKLLPRYTVKDYERWEGDWELVEGIPYALASPSFKHQRIVAILFFLWEGELEEQEKCKDCKLTFDTDFIVSEDTIFRPDLALVCEPVEEKITKPPTLIVEVVSPSSKKMDEEIKPIYYAKVGVEYYILVYPEEEKVVLKTLNGESYITETVEGETPIKLSEDCELTLNPSEIWKRV